VSIILHYIKIGWKWINQFGTYVYVLAAWLMFVTVLLVIYAAGMMLFVSRTIHTETHVAAGWGSHLPLLLLIVVAIVAWIPRRLAAWLVAVVAVHTLQLILATVGDDLPLLAAAHPLNAMLLAWLSFRHAQRAGQLLLKGTSPEPARVQV
jgi:hypothetical protein